MSVKGRDKEHIKHYPHKKMRACKKFKNENHIDQSKLDITLGTEGVHNDIVVINFLLYEL